MKETTGSARRFAAFRRAVIDLNEEPTPLNVRRYLAASRLLEGQPHQPPAQTTALAGGRKVRPPLGRRTQAPVE
jgi:hypothetical protein